VPLAASAVSMMSGAGCAKDPPGELAAPLRAINVLWKGSNYIVD
jgi:hypothetical protein